ncbi:hypothetical protein BCV70DRAFT_152004, partial [Testicularia cyperi]
AALFDALAADRRELATLIQQKRLLASAQRNNALHAQTLGSSLAALRRLYRELKSVLSALDAADVMDAEDQSLEAIRTVGTIEDQMATCPFPVTMFQQIPLLRLQAIERAEHDNALASRAWLAAEDRQLLAAVRAAAQKAHFKAHWSQTPSQSDISANSVPVMGSQDALEFAEQVDLAHVAVDPATYDARNDGQGLDWNMIVTRVPSRNLEEIRTRWRQVLRPSINQAAWTSEETSRLAELVRSHIKGSTSDPEGPSAATSAADSLSTRPPVLWQQVATELGTGRTAHACFARFCNLIVLQNQPEWTQQEDEAIKTLFCIFRGSWRLMSLHLSGSPNLLLQDSHDAYDSLSSLPATCLGKVSRDSPSVYRRYRNILDPALARGKWSQAEDEALIRAVHHLGLDGEDAKDAERWGTAAAWVPGRTSSQCRERWTRRLRALVSATQAATAPLEDESAPSLSTSLQAFQLKARAKLAWTKDLDDLLASFLDSRYEKKSDSPSFVQIAKEIAAAMGQHVTDKQVRDRIVTLKNRK